MPNRLGIFAGSDIVPGERTVTVLASHGKKAAQAMGTYRRGVGYEPPLKPELTSFDKLNRWKANDIREAAEQAPGQGEVYLVHPARAHRCSFDPGQGPRWGQP